MYEFIMKEMVDIRVFTWQKFWNIIFRVVKNRIKRHDLLCFYVLI